MRSTLFVPRFGRSELCFHLRFPNIMCSKKVSSVDGVVVSVPGFPKVGPSDKRIQKDFMFILFVMHLDKKGDKRNGLNPLQGKLCSFSFDKMEMSSGGKRHIIPPKLHEGVWMIDQFTI